MDYEKKYKEALEWAKQIKDGKIGVVIDDLVEKFPELKENEDERIRKELIYFFKNHMDSVYEEISDNNAIITWLEKKGENNSVPNWMPKFLDKLRSKKNYFDWDENKEIEGHILAIIQWMNPNYFNEKQDEQEQLYIRFGEIPTDEKSKIYQGEIEVGTENGVSVYPAFKTDEGDIVLGLNLPITKTTLYTQQHLIEYDDRPCYLVKGDYIGKDTDGQPLINNVSIVERINSYRVKEGKQGEKKTDDKVEPKFKVGDWVVSPNGVYWHIDAIRDSRYQVSSDLGSCADWPLNTNIYHKFTIQDVKEGDVLVAEIDEEPNYFIYIFNGYDKDGFLSHCYLDAYINKFHEGIYHNNYNIGVPAIKEQRDLLFQKMKEAGYTWDAEKKELKMIEQKASIDFSDLKTWKYIVDAVLTKEHGIGQYLDNGETEIMAEELQERFGNIMQNPAWSEEDEEKLTEVISEFEAMKNISSTIFEKNLCDEKITFLKSLKERIKGDKQ